MIYSDPNAAPLLNARYDVCIVGAGAAGVALALELNGSAHRVCVLEAGGFGYDKATQAWLQGAVEGDRYPLLRNTRMSGLGGTSAVWAGWCRPLESLDFAGRADLGISPWPAAVAQLGPFYQHASELCGLGTVFPDSCQLQTDPEPALIPLQHDDIAHRRFCVHARHFGRYYRKQLELSANIDVYLHAPVTRLFSADGSERIATVEVATPQHGRVQVAAGRFVLAAGGIENPRLLLLSAESPESAPGNQHGLVGRFFGDHPFVDPGHLVLNRPALLTRYFPRPAPHPAEGGFRDVLSLAPRALVTEQVLNAGIFFYPRYESHAAFASPEGKAFLELINKLRGKAVPGDLRALVAQALRSPKHMAIGSWRRFMVKHAPALCWRIRAMFETEFCCDNRVTLSQEKDSLGRPRPQLRWRLSPLDLHSMSRGFKLLDQALRQAGTGRIELAFPDEPEAWRAAAEGGKHHMGSTRMHLQPSQGVVDADSRVHGITNLYIAGSSVFPSGGFANPTLTIVALAVRLGQHLRGRLDRRG